MDHNDSESGLSAYLQAWDGRTRQREDTLDHLQPRPINPFIGLRHFDSFSAPYLFGRDDSKRGILERLEDEQVIFVVGGSGTGKSSIVRGKVVQWVKFNLDPIRGRNGSWEVIDFRPMTSPVKRFVSRFWETAFEPFVTGENTRVHQEFSQLFGCQLSDLKSKIEEDIRRRILPVKGEGEAPLHDGFRTAQQRYDQLDTAVRTGRKDSDANLLIVIDQFEEIFRTGVDQDEKNNLLAMIRYVFERKPPGVFLIVTMRAEDQHRCAQVPGLVDIANHSMFHVGWLWRKDLRSVIVEPVRRFCSSWRLPIDFSNHYAPFEEVVVETLCDHVTKIREELTHQSDHLPLFQHGMAYLWETVVERWRQDQGASTLTVTKADLDRTIADLRQWCEERPGGDSQDRLDQFADHEWMKIALQRAVKVTHEEAINVFNEKFPDAQKHIVPVAGDSIASIRAISGRLGEIAIRAAFCALATKDENGRYYREFANPGEVRVLRLDKLFSKESADDLTEALDAALNVYARREFLVRTDDDGKTLYDVTHEALIRTSDIIGKWVNRDADVLNAVISSLNRGSVADDDLPKIKRIYHDSPIKSGTSTDETLVRLYRRTFHESWVESALREAQARKDDLRQPDDSRAAADVNRVRQFYNDKQKAVQDAQAKKDNQTRLKIGGLAFLTALIVSILVSVAIADWHDRRRDMLISHAIAADPIREHQVIGATLSEVYQGYRILEDERHFRVNHHPKSAVPMLMSPRHIWASLMFSKEEFVAHPALDQKLRELLGSRFQLRHESGVNIKPEPIGDCRRIFDNAMPVDPLLLVESGRTVELDLTPKPLANGIRQIDPEFRLRSGSAAKVLKTNTALGGTNVVPLIFGVNPDGRKPKEVARVCLSHNILTIDRSRHLLPNQRPTGFPEIYLLDLVNSHDVGQQNQKVDLDVTRLVSGSQFMELSEDDPRGKHDSWTDIIKPAQGANYYQVWFAAGGKAYVATFHPNLARPWKVNADSHDRVGEPRNIQSSMIEDHVHFVELPLAGAQEQKMDLYARLIIDRCASRLTIELFRRGDKDLDDRRLRACDKDGTLHLQRNDTSIPGDDQYKVKLGSFFVEDFDQVWLERSKDSHLWLALKSRRSPRTLRYLLLLDAASVRGQMAEHWKGTHYFVTNQHPRDNRYISTVCQNLKCFEGLKKVGGPD